MTQSNIAPANVGMDEWQAYLNTIESIPDELGIVEWWGVSGMPFCALSTFHLFHYIYINAL